jgi:hypothetical protein
LKQKLPEARHLRGKEKRKMSGMVKKGSQNARRFSAFSISVSLSEPSSGIPYLGYD